MRFRLTLRVEREKGTLLPLNYQYELSSWIYRLLNRSDSRFGAWLHERGYCGEGKNFKLFTFSHLQVPAFQVKGDRMDIRSERIGLVVSFYPMELAEPFVSGTFCGCSFVLGDRKSQIHFSVEAVERCPEVEFSRKMEFRALSPIFMDERRGRRKNPTRHLSPDDPAFGPLIHANLVEKYRAIHKCPPPEEWEPTRFRLLGSLKSKVIAIKQSSGMPTRLRGYLCRFALEGEPELLSIAYHVGIGRLNSQGFGCMEVLEKQKKLSS